ncbi:RNA polymerase recycling motor HelD [Bacillus kwashiorkori]|uniref:RNA polymerase recycling motor HelD n=1 Tax=Bacillus kwashiorkori TaxID=1522318 RepID=UPI0007853A61|nr:RNA polymerase recycling motor HelD [Bacillus kwashiorkori]
MSESNHQRIDEQKRLKETIVEIDRKISVIKQKSGSLKEQIVSLRQTFWDDVTVNLDEPDDVIETHTSLRQQAELLSERERSHRHFHKQLKNLQRLKSSPYFGRMDFLESGENEAEVVYIGLFSLMDENNEEFLVYDWRAPISSMYYDYVPGPAKYETMDGPIKGEITLKRQYIIRDGKIKGMFDTGITIGDEILQQVLSDQADTNMKNIVATIQKEQNEIIRHDRKKYLIVQGAAGSGKTSAALQRVAYLLYRYRERLTADNILLFSPNPMFNSYVGNVLPELGEDNMQQSTFFEYLQHRLGDTFLLENPFSQMEYMLSTDKDDKYFIRMASISFKTSLDYKHLLDLYVKDLSEGGLIFKNILFRKEVFISSEEISEYFYSLAKTISIPNRLDITKDWLLARLDEKEKAELDREWVEHERDLLEREDYLKAYKVLQREQRFTEDTFNDMEREEKLLAQWIVGRRIKPLKRKVEQLSFLNLNQIYQQFFLWVMEQSGTSFTIPENWEKVTLATVRRLKKNQLYYEDATPFLYLKDKLEGKHTYTSIRQLFIDEAQDYSPFQFAFLQEIFPFSKMTILGDVNQSIFTHSVRNQNGLAKTSELFPKDELEQIVLTKSYRSTRQIVEFTEQILTDGHSIEPFNRNGNKPTLSIIRQKDSLNKHIISEVHSMQQRGHETIAIICKTGAESLEVYNELKNNIPVQLIRKETYTYEKGISILPSYLSKGIEFDGVIIYNCANDVYKDEDERKLFYTACTRAMHELHLYSVGDYTHLLANVAEDKYQLIDDN